MTYLFIFILGSIIGSFLNVCIYRMPRGESIARPASRCASCKRPIPWYDNIPLLSFIILKGRCRFCKSRIRARYFVVELLSAATFTALFLSFGFSAEFWVYSLVTFGLIAVTFIDLEFQLIPDIISIGGLFLGIIISIFVPALHYKAAWKASLVSSLSGALTGGGMVYLTGVFGKLAFKKDSMGGGDVKLMAMLGAFLGWKMSVLIFFLSPFFAMPSALYVKFIKKSDVIPYGPYISMAGFTVILYGQKIWGLIF